MNGTASGNLTSDGVVERNEAVSLLTSFAGDVNAGEEIEINFSLQIEQALSAWEFDLRFDPAYLELLEVLPETELEGMHLGNFNTRKAEEGKLRAIWYSPYANTVLFDGKKDFSLRFKVKQPFGQLSEVISMENTLLRARAYEEDGTPHRIQLRTAETELADRSVPLGNEVYVEALPNPFQGRLQFVIQSTQPDDFRLELFDLNGRLLSEQKGRAETGQVFLNVEGAEHWPSGLVQWRLTVGTQVLTGQVVKE